MQEEIETTALRRDESDILGYIGLTVWGSRLKGFRFWGVKRLRMAQRSGRDECAGERSKCAHNP